MKKNGTLRGLVEKALAFAHAALDDTTPRHVIAARRYAEAILPRVHSMKPKAVTLREASELFELVGKLRAVMTLLDRKLQFQSRTSN